MSNQKEPFADLRDSVRDMAQEFRVLADTVERQRRSYRTLVIFSFVFSILTFIGLILFVLLLTAYIPFSRW